MVPLLCIAVPPPSGKMSRITRAKRTLASQVACLEQARLKASLTKVAAAFFRTTIDSVSLPGVGWSKPEGDESGRGQRIW
jgi:hypothetical protein